MASKKTKKNNHKDKGTTINNALAQKLTPAELDTIKSQFTKDLKSAFSSEDIMQRLWKEYLPVVETGDASKLRQTKDSMDLYREALAVYGLDNHVPLSETVARKYRPLVVEFCCQLVKDYGCHTAGEKALAEIVVSAYTRILILSRALNAPLSGESISIGTREINFYSMMSKELDRANRHFTTSLQTLAHLKQPPLNVNLKTNNAYVAHAQQFNMDNRDPEADEEIINSK